MTLSCILLVILLIILITYLFCFLCNRNSKLIYNPDPSYWLARSDGTGNEVFFPQRNVYLKQSITDPGFVDTCNTDPKNPKPCSVSSFSYCRRDMQDSKIQDTGKCITYVNSEIYNGVCCMDEIEKVSKQLFLKSGDSPSEALSKFQNQTGELVKAVCKYRDSEICGCKLQPNPILVDNPFTSLLQLVEDTFLNNPYQFATLETRLKVQGLNNGSRGWGFWNTIGLPGMMEFAWFMQQDGKNDDGTPYPLNGFWIYVTTKDGKTSSKKLDDLDENWHDYKIVWKKDSLEFFIDNKSVFVSDVVPQGNMAFHGWVDNAVFLMDAKTGLPIHLTHSLQGEKSQTYEYIKIKME